QRKHLVVRKLSMIRAKNKHGYADEIQHYRRHVQHIVSPITPAGKKSVEVAENFFGPKIDSTFSRIAVRQLDHGDSLGPKEQQKRNDPQPNRDTTIRGNTRDYIQIENCDHEQQNQVPAPEDAF